MKLVFLANCTKKIFILKKPFTGKSQNVLKAAKKSYDLTEKLLHTLLFITKEALLKKIGLGLKGGFYKVKIEEIKKWHRKEKVRWISSLAIDL
ncbi:MAG: hypothetical protein GNW80_00900 [Asgard group archaeon]|nr:hypothetical protein [Asgard group archaeon]